jgi:hypothetical protein
VEKLKTAVKCTKEIKGNDTSICCLSDDITKLSAPRRSMAWALFDSLVLKTVTFNPNAFPNFTAITTGFRRFAGCRKHPAKTTLHSAKPLPGAALGKEPPAKN